MFIHDIKDDSITHDGVTGRNGSQDKAFLCKTSGSTSGKEILADMEKIKVYTHATHHTACDFLRLFDTFIHL